MTSYTCKNILEIPVEERPRERFRKLGVSSLSDIELLSLMLGSGGKGRSVSGLAMEVLSVLDKENNNPDILQLQNIPGIGLARMGLIAGSLEFARRRLRPAAKRISQPADVYPLLTHWADRPQEHFLVISLNGAHEVLRLRVVTQGILNRTIVHPREVFVNPLADRAAAVICAHNHPSGSVDPSSEDQILTRRLQTAGDILGIPLLDHIIFSNSDYYSFLEKGAMVPAAHQE